MKRILNINNQLGYIGNGKTNPTLQTYNGESACPSGQSWRDQLSATLRNMIEDGQKRLAVDYNMALEQARRFYRSLRQIFAGYDVILTPATTGTAPRGLEATEIIRHAEDRPARDTRKSRASWGVDPRTQLHHRKEERSQ